MQSNLSPFLSDNGSGSSILASLSSIWIPPVIANGYIGLVVRFAIYLEHEMPCLGLSLRIHRTDSIRQVMFVSYAGEGHKRQHSVIGRKRLSFAF